LDIKNLQAPIIYRWSTGKSSLSQTWTEFVGRTMQSDQSPEQFTEEFKTWLLKNNEAWMEILDGNFDFRDKASN